MLATYRRFGLPVEWHGQDLWLAGRKIAGSGAATIGRCAVFASSFLLHFPAERFARCIASPLRPGAERISRLATHRAAAGDDGLGEPSDTASR